ncbi:MAG: dihydrodipicolinate reductase [Pseudomonadota bacterium]
MSRSSLFAAVAIALLPFSANATEGWSLAPDGTQFQRIAGKGTFVRIIQQGDLSRLGIRLKVRPDGQITGRAWGRNVTGQWSWRDGYFCRNLFWGKREVGPNCQEVKVGGNMVRFTSDRGNGDFADLRLR